MTEYCQKSRLSTDQDVGIQYPGGKTLVGRIRDFNVDELFIELDTANLPVHTLVQLLLPIKGEETENYQHVPVAISRCTQDGIGLLYCGNHEHIFEYLQSA